MFQRDVIIAWGIIPIIETSEHADYKAVTLVKPTA